MRGNDKSIADGLLDDLAQSGYSAQGFKKFFAHAWVESKKAIHESPRRFRMALLASLFAAIVFGSSISFIKSLLDLWAFLFLVLWFVSSCAMLLLHLGMVRDEAGKPRHALLIPNTLTFLRLTLAPLSYWLVSVVEIGSVDAFIAVGILGFLSLTDTLDGVLARALDQRSDLGKILDPLADIIYFTALSLGLYKAGLLPVFVLALFLIRYPGTFFGALVLFFRQGSQPVQATIIGKVVTAICAFILPFSACIFLLEPTFFPREWLNILVNALSIPLGINIVFLGYVVLKKS